MSDNAYEITGPIYRIGPTVQVSEKFRKREVVLATEPGKYPQLVPFTLTGDRCEQLDAFADGDVVTIEFNLRGREWTSPRGEVKFFGENSGFRIERVGSATPRPPRGPAPPPPTDDDLPF